MIFIADLYPRASSRVGEYVCLLHRHANPWCASSVPIFLLSHILFWKATMSGVAPPSPLTGNPGFVTVFQRQVRMKSTMLPQKSTFIIRILQPWERLDTRHRSTGIINNKVSLDKSIIAKHSKIYQEYLCVLSLDKDMVLSFCPYCAFKTYTNLWVSTLSVKNRSKGPVLIS